MCAKQGGNLFIPKEKKRKGSQKKKHFANNNEETQLSEEKKERDEQRKNKENVQSTKHQDTILKAEDSYNLFLTFSSALKEQNTRSHIEAVAAIDSSEREGQERMSSSECDILSMLLKNGVLHQVTPFLDTTDSGSEGNSSSRRSLPLIAFCSGALFQYFAHEAGELRINLTR